MHLSTIRTFSTFKPFHDQSNSSPSPSSISNSLSCSSSPISLQLGFRTRRRRSHGIKLMFISCNNSYGNIIRRSSNNGDEHDDDYIEAVVLVSETLRHYHMQKQGFLDGMQWTSIQLFPLSFHSKQSKTDFSPIGDEFLRRFQSPTIFLKISCDGDLLLPISVGEPAVEKLIEAVRNDEKPGPPNQFQFVKNLVENLGYEVKMIRITKRVVNTYHARIYFSKPGEHGILSVDARPSDAINVAKRCKVSIYVNKHIVLADAIKIAHGTIRRNDAKSVYDVFLDSATEGPDLLSEELDLVKNMDIAIKEERYKDAAILRDTLRELRMSRDEL